MGLLVDGVWRDNWYDTDKSDGRFERFESTFATGSRRTARRARMAAAVSRPSPADTISMSQTPVLGRTGP